MIKTNELFEGVDLQGHNIKEIQNCKELYEYLVKAGQKANFLNEGLDSQIDEGVFTAMLGGATGALIGPAIGRALCRVLGISEGGTLGKLLTSTLVTTAIGAEIVNKKF